jgi:hypothetical protein
VGGVVWVFLRCDALCCRYSSMSILPLGILRMFDYVSHVPFQATFNGMERIRVSLSFG